MMQSLSIVRRRWSDHDTVIGPFTYARDRGEHPLGVVVDSGDDEYPGCCLRLRGFGHTLIIWLPQILRPHREKVVAVSWDEATVQRMGRNWYYNVDSREFGFTLSQGGFLQVFYGRQTHDSSTDRTWCKHLPFTQWRHVRHSLYDTEGKLFFENARGNRWDETYDAKQRCPSVSFAFADFDGERLEAKTIVEEREWRFGDGWFKWLSMFRSPRVSRSLEISFSGETGPRKGSWKGGTIGHGIGLVAGDTHESAFRRYCVEHDMTFAGVVNQ